MFVLPVCKDAFIPLYSGSRTCERAAWRHSSTASNTSLGLCLKKKKTLKPSVIIFLNSGLQDYTVRRPSPDPVCVHLTPQSGSLVHFSSMVGPSRRHHAQVLNVVTFLRASSTSFSTASTTVVLDQTHSVSIFVKDYYAWFNESFM